MEPRQPGPVESTLAQVLSTAAGLLVMDMYMKGPIYQWAKRWWEHRKEAHVASRSEPVYGVAAGAEAILRQHNEQEASE